MSKTDDNLERWLIPFLRMIPAWVAVVLGVSLFAVGLALPLSTHSDAGLTALSVLCGTGFAAVVLFGWFVVDLEARLDSANKRHLVDWTSNLRLLDAEEFEWFVGEIFRREGFQVTETGSQDHADGNIDLVLTKQGERRVVQCKRWQAWKVGVEEIRMFAGTLMREGLPPGAGVFVTLSTFTEQAREEAAKTGLVLLNGNQLEARWSKVRRTEPCPTCGQPMLVDKSRHGWWLRCISPGCSGKRDLAGEPGPAIELLTQQPRT